MKCCHFCVAPKRHLGCHGKCSEYKDECAENEVKRELVRSEKTWTEHSEKQTIGNIQYRQKLAASNLK